MSATAKNTDHPVARTLRLSVTGECNLTCFYCKPTGESRELFAPKTLVQASDVSKLVKIVGELGITRVIIGGGEPLLRKDAPNFVKSAFAHKAIQDVRLATNGTHLKTFADPLRKMGLRKVDVNVDSLNFMKYQKITGRDSLYRVLDGVEKVEKLNFTDIRLNIFLFKDINDSELVEFARMTKDRKLHLRFLEYHPRFANGDPYAERLHLTVAYAKQAINDYQRLVPVYDLEDEVQVPTYQFADGTGKMSFLSKAEIEAEDSVPHVLFNAEGILSNELVPNRPLPILADLRRDAKEDRLHRMIEKVLSLHTGLAKPKKEPAHRPSKTANIVTRRSSSSRSASARR